MRRETQVLNDRVRTLETNNVLTSQIADPLFISDPVEGEHVIDPTDDKHAWYVNGAWHKAGGVFHPQGIIRGSSRSLPDPTNINYFNWGTGNVGYIESGGNGTLQVVSLASFSDPDGTFTIDHAGEPEVFCYAHTPGIYLVSINVIFFDTSAPPTGGEFSNFLEWVPGGYLGGGGGTGYPEVVGEYHDQAHAPATYRGAVQGIGDQSLVYVDPSLASGGAPLNRFRAYSSYGSYDTLSFNGSVWKIGDWSTD